MQISDRTAMEPFVLPRNAGEVEAAKDYLRELTRRGFVDWPDASRLKDKLEVRRAGNRMPRNTPTP